MRITANSTGLPRRPAGYPVRCGLFAAGLAIASALAMPQTMAQDRQSPQSGEPGFFEGVGRWFEEQADKFNSSFKDAGKKVQDFSHEAGMAARITVEGAKDAAGAVARIPTARVVTGHEKCSNAPNGAPDCVAAAVAICKAKGFATGKSADMTTAEVCPPKIYLSGRNSGPGCHTETFVSRALCQ